MPDGRRAALRWRKQLRFPETYFSLMTRGKRGLFPGACSLTVAIRQAVSPVHSRASHDNIKAGDESLLVENWATSVSAEALKYLQVAVLLPGAFCFFSSFHHPVSRWSSTPQCSVQASKDLAGRRPRIRNVCVHEVGYKFKSPSWKRGAPTFLEFFPSSHKQDRCLINQEQRR